MGTLLLASHLSAENVVLLSPSKVAFDFKRPQKGARLFSPNFPRGNCLLSLPFVSFDKMLLRVQLATTTLFLFLLLFLG